MKTVWHYYNTEIQSTSLKVVWTGVLGSQLAGLPHANHYRDSYFSCQSMKPLEISYKKMLHHSDDAKKKENERMSHTHTHVHTHTHTCVWERVMVDSVWGLLQSPLQLYYTTEMKTKSKMKVKTSDMMICRSSGGMLCLHNQPTNILQELQWKPTFLMSMSSRWFCTNCTLAL